MAYQAGKPKAAGPGPQTKAGVRPAGETYVASHLWRGGLVYDRKDSDGNPVKSTNYGRGQSQVPSSVGVAQSAELTDFSIAPAGGDEALQSLIRQGTGVDESKAPAVASGQERPIPPGNVADAFGMGSARSRQPTKPAELPTSLANDQGEPVRKPPAGNGQL